MEKVHISKFQLYVIMVLFGIGTASLYGFGMNAKQDAWLAVVGGYIGGVILFLGYCYIFYKYPDYSFTVMLEKVLGKITGKIVAAFYIVYFLYIGSFVLRDIGELITMFVLPGTPIFVINLLIMIVAFYIVYLGLEVIVRTGEIFFFGTIAGYLIFSFFIIMTGCIELENLFPILEEGIKPVFKSSLLLSLFPFADMVVFTMIFHNLNKKKAVIKVGLLAFTTVFILLLIITIFNITVLGVYMAENSIYPTIEVVRLINVGEFIQRLDALAVIVFMIGSSGKVIIYTYAASIALQELLNKPKHHKFVLPVFLIILFGSIFITDNLFTHVYFAKKVIRQYINFPFLVIIPGLLILIIMIKSLLLKKNK